MATNSVEIETRRTQPASEPTPAREPEAEAPRARRGGHVPELDGVRGLAILLVLLYHYGAAFGPVTTASGLGARLVSRAVATGWCGVDLFFVLSGFLITGILYDTKGRPNYFRTFYARRTVRIFPLYYGVLAAAFVLDPWLGSPFRSAFAPRENQAWFWLYDANLLSALKGGAAAGGLNHFWSLAVEEHFYLVWPLLIAGLGRGRAMWACVAVASGALAFRTFGVVTNYVRYVDFNYVVTPARVDAMAIGGLVALAVRGPGGFAAVRPYARAGAVAAGLVLAAILLRHHGALYWSGKDTQTVGYTALAVFFGSTLALLVGAGGAGPVAAFCRNRVLRFLGTYSYGIYVYHFAIVPAAFEGLGLDRVLRDLGPYPLGPLALATGLTAASVAVAWASWHVYERPFLTLKRLFPY